MPLVVEGGRAPRFTLPDVVGKKHALADVPGEGGVPKVCDQYGVWQEKSMYGRKYMGVVRTTYLIDANGTVARRWDRVKVPGHGEEVLEAVRTLKK